MTVNSGSPAGAIIGGGQAGAVPEGEADAVIAAGLRVWLSVEERQSLAAASQRAAVAGTGASVAWQAQDGAGTVTATGNAAPVGDIYRSLRGQVCRNVRQSFDKAATPQAETVALCRLGVAGAGPLWVVAD